MACEREDRAERFQTAERRLLDACGIEGIIRRKHKRSVEVEIPG
jgi:hypothetical protein